MGNVATKVSQALGIAKVAKAAQTPQDYEALVARVREELIAKTAELADLEQERESVLLDGGDEGDFYARLVRVREQVDTLKLNLAEAQRRHERVSAEKFTADLEANARHVRETHVVGAEQALIDFHLAMMTVADAAARLQGHFEIISYHDGNMKDAKRVDLMIGKQALLERVAREISGDDDESDKPVRTGRLDEPDMRRGYELFRSTDAADKVRYDKWLAQHGPVKWEAHETDEAYTLRVQSWAARKADLARKESPFAVTGDRAISAIEAVIRPAGMFEASRGVRRMRIDRYVRPDGRSVRWFSSSDGLAANKEVGATPQGGKLASGG